MIERAMSPYLLVLPGKYPMVIIIGPRQSGTTALVRHLFSGIPFANLENSEKRAFAFDLIGVLSVAAGVFFHESSEPIAMANGLRMTRGGNRVFW